MPVSLPDPVSVYFEANRLFDVDAMLAPFAPDAVVHDEKRTHRGHDALRAWIEEATIGNQALATPLEATAQGDRLDVTAEVAGAFPGSPVRLTFHFMLANGAIAALEID